jgi:hypothetical protein
LYAFTGSFARPLTIDPFMAECCELGLNHVELTTEYIQGHLHDNGGESDARDPLVAYEPVVEAVDAEYSVFEMKSVEDLRACLD